MSKNKIALQLRKFHRGLSVPMTAMVVANISTRKYEFNTIIENVTAITMVLMTVTGFTLFMLTMRWNGKFNKQRRNES